jgi:glycine cleavage system aminomethyltransferase T
VVGTRASSCSSEFGWELHIPNDVALTVYDAPLSPGEDLGIRHAGLGALNSLRLEKAYRDYGVDIDNSDTLLEAGLGWAVAWDKADFIGRDAMVAQRDAGVLTSRLVQVLVGDPEPLVYGHEQLYRDGERVGQIENGAYGHTLGGGVGLASVELDEASATTSSTAAAGNSTSWAPATRPPCRACPCTTRSESGSRRSRARPSRVSSNASASPAAMTRRTRRRHVAVHREAERHPILGCGHGERDGRSTSATGRRRYAGGDPAR